MNGVDFFPPPYCLPSNLVKAGEEWAAVGGGPSVQASPLLPRGQAGAEEAREAWGAGEGASPGLEAACSPSPPRWWRLEREKDRII